MIRMYLDERQINYTTEKRFENCRDKKTLPFDFYLPDYNMCIEFDGAQHFGEYDGFGDYETTKRHDAIKDQYCLDNGIKIVRIPYYNFDQTIEILNQNITV